MAAFPSYVTQAQVVAVDARSVTVELTVDPTLLRDARKEQAVWGWASDPAAAGQTMAQLTCGACGAVVLVLGASAPTRWICACGQDQAAY